jgi:uncharacterized circularly permuted ATP-grasp superfamily protein/uncharacterized alpha-E superfamily protein
MDLLAGYRQQARDWDGYSEVTLESGARREHWQSLLTWLEQMTPERRAGLRDQARQLLREHSVVDDGLELTATAGQAPELDLVPWILPEGEWQAIECGVRQYHRLLEHLLADLYGTQRVIRSGLVPAALVYGQAGFLRGGLSDAHGLRGQAVPHISLSGIDLVRQPSGAFVILGCQIQTPVGIGYAMENRQISFRLLRQALNENHVRLLAPFFTTLRANLADCAPVTREDPHVVLLTAGTEQASIHPEHAFLANYLGLTLVQGGDLTVRGGRVQFKTLDGLYPVDVVWRLLADRDCDPLETGDESGGTGSGVAGLVHAAREARTAVVNPVGAGLLEDPAWLPLMGEICRLLLGEEPCFAVASTAFGAVPGGSVVPVLTGNGCLEVGCARLRTFVTSGAQGQEVLPGGFARVAAIPEQLGPDGDGAGMTRDVWVLSAHPVVRANRPPIESISPPSPFMGEISSRIAENLFWMGRYAERTEHTVRLLRALSVLPAVVGSTGSRMGDQDGFTGADSVIAAVQTLHHVLSPLSGVPGVPDASPEALLHHMITAVGHPGSVVALLHTLVMTAQRVRDRLSNDTWRVVQRLRRLQQELASGAGVQDTDSALEDVLAALSSLAGLTMENMTRGLGWQFFVMGRRLERAILTVELLRGTVVVPTTGTGERIILETLLLATDSSMTFRRRYRTHLSLQPLLDLIGLDPGNPRSIAFQLEGLERHVAQLPRRSGVPAYRTAGGRIILDALNTVRLADTGQLVQVDSATGRRSALEQLLGHLGGGLPRFSVALSGSYFQHATPHVLRTEWRHGSAR